MQVSALIIEDHPIYRDALSNFMQTTFKKEQILATASIEEVSNWTARIEQLKIILIDLNLPGLKGVDAVRCVRKYWPETPVIVISACQDRQVITAALRAGVRLVISKSVSGTTIAGLIDKILSNAPCPAEWITCDARPEASSHALISFTTRQSEIMRFLGQGLSNKEMCLRMGLAETTVKMHISLIFRTLKVKNRIQALVTARQLGIAA
ncbi:response regulator transcription factor [Undibacterium pigrum]|uniref:LuxR family two component transcriptional regulator n=1 Tax=Undibacterium pigrum TaxID=401470 RepID=A0A318J565_9BURK|nr:response regulator transcription factor [Undibacterium pigrum]PXX43932.1 LuxR family two component transcriptional regulator [Undibacterium pigrum]